MYRLPKGFDGSFLVGRTLERVSFSENTVSFGFDENVAITVTSSLKHELLSDSVHTDSEVQSVPLSHSRLMQLTGRSLTIVKGEEDGTLILSFDNGQVLALFDDTPNYESYSIKSGECEIIV